MMVSSILYRVMGSAYDWAMRNLPYWIMYKHTYIDTQHKMWLPRYGYTKRQIAEAEKRAEELNNSINWE